MTDKWAEHKQKFCGCKDASRLNRCQGRNNCELPEGHPERVSAAPQPSAVPGLRHTDQWESARVADYNAGWNARHAADFSRLSDEQIFDIAEPFGEFRYGDAQGDKRLAFARAIIAAARQEGGKV